jgi:hypothetical protein
MMFAVALENRDLLKNMRPEVSWVVPDALAVRSLFIVIFSVLICFGFAQDNLRTYAIAFLLSPALASYRGKVANKLLVRNIATCYLI